jgi:hypothetical protein
MFNNKVSATMDNINTDGLDNISRFNPSLKMIALDKESNSIFDDDNINTGEVNLR